MFELSCSHAPRLPHRHNISSLSSQNLVSQKSVILQEKEFSYRLSQFLVCDREIQIIYIASNHLSCRLKNFS